MTRLRLRFWQFVHDQSEAFWYWVYYAKLRPLQRAEDKRIYSTTPRTAVLLCTIEATDAEKAVGITARRIYGSSPESGIGIQMDSGGSHVCYTPSVIARDGGPL